MKFPVACGFCGKTSEAGVCESCAAALFRALCPERAPLPYTEGTLTLFDYDDKLVRRGIFALKNRGVGLFARTFTQCALPHVLKLGVTFSCVSYVPRRIGEHRLRGVDQARVLARFLARELGLPCCKLLFRRGFSRRQHALGAEERAANVRGKFRAARKVPRGAVLLVDDVVTTGATATECARVLSLSGVEKIYVFAPARGGSL